MVPTVQLLGNFLNSFHACTFLAVISNVGARKNFKATFAKLVHGATNADVFVLHFALQKLSSPWEIFCFHQIRFDGFSCIYPCQLFAEKTKFIGEELFQEFINELT